MGGRSLQYVMLSPPSMRADGVARLELYGDARVTGGVLRLTDLLPGFTLDDVIIDGSRDEDAVRRRASASAAPTTRRAPCQSWSRGLTFDDVVDILKASVANARAYAIDERGESRAVTETLDMVRSAPRPSPPRTTPRRRTGARAR